MDGRERAGLGFAAAGVALGAFVPAFARLTTGRADALAVATGTSLFAAVAAAAWLAHRGQLGWLVARAVAPRLALIGALGTGVAFLCLFEGVRRTSAIDAVLCLQAESIYALVLARVFLGQPVTARRLAAVAVLGAGIVLAVGATGVRASTGVAFLLATPLCWQVSHLVVLRGLPGVPARVLTGARYVYGGLVLGAVWLAGGGLARLPEGAALAELGAALAFQGVVLSFVGTLLWYETLARLDLARSTAIVVPSVPLLSLGASFLLLGEVATPAQWAGLALMTAGVVGFVTAPHALLPRERIAAPAAPLAVVPDPEAIAEAGAHPQPPPGEDELAEVLTAPPAHPAAPRPPAAGGGAGSFALAGCEEEEEEEEE